MNCAIYYCARLIADTYTPDPEGERAWEDRLIREVLGYIQRMTRIVAPTDCVYVAVDGVAPMAKIRQQRARRFKSAVLAAEETAARGLPPTPRWDSNAITPGTAFMGRLTAALRGFQGCPRVIVSPADEAGEGEQKIMAWLREPAQHPLRDVVIYGLDADLIVLALLEHGLSGRTVDLFREETEFSGGVKTNNLGEVAYLYLQTTLLTDALYERWGRSKSSSPYADQSRQDFLVDFMGIMHLLGNDFVPHGLALKINDEGIEHVLEILQGIPLTKGPLVFRDRITYNVPVLRDLLEGLHPQEEIWMLRGIRRKLEARVGATAAKDPAAAAVAALQDKPVEWAAEKVWMEQRRVEGAEKPRWFFRRDWRRLYYQHGLWGSSVEETVRAYLQTLEWSLQYYMTGVTSYTTWYYPWLLPPLLSDVATGLRSCEVLPAPTGAAPPLKPLEQLAMVLPQSSFGLLPAALQGLPARQPHAWPTAWSVFSLGRRFLWECEPLIPLIQPAQIREWVEDCLEAED